MKLLSLNINKFNHDVTKHSVLSYVNSINANLSVLQEYTCKLSIQNAIYPNNINIETTDKRFSFTIGISEEYSRGNENANNFIELNPQNNKYPSVLGVHLSPNESFPINMNSDIICGDFNTGINSLNYPTDDDTPYCTLINKNYFDLWSYAVKESKAFIIDCFGNEHLASPDVFYRTFSVQRINDFIMAKDIFKDKLIKICIDYRTLAFSDHCAIIATFKE